MPQSLAKVIIHVVFSTKYRAPVLVPAIRSALHAYMATTIRNAECGCYRAGGVEDHVHLAIKLSRMVTIADLVEDVKSSSSKWLKTQLPELERFRWQRGYGVFSANYKGLERLCRYIDNQEEHHRKQVFKDEFRESLKRANIEYDERYVWD